MLRPREFCLFVVFMGFSTEFYILLTEWLNSTRMVSINIPLTGERQSLMYMRSKLVYATIEKGLSYIVMFSFIIFLPSIWKKLKSDYKFAFLCFVIKEVLIGIPLHAYSVLGIESSFGFNRTSRTLFFKDVLMQLVLRLTIFSSFIVPLVTYTKSISKTTPKSSHNVKLEIVSTKRVNDIIDDNKLETVEEMNYDEQVNKDIGSPFDIYQNVWVFVLIILLVIMLLFSIFAIPISYIFNDLVDAPTLDISDHYKSLMKSINRTQKNSVLISLTRRSSHPFIKIIGVWNQKAVISESLLFTFLPKELIPIGAYTNSLLSNQTNLVLFFLKSLKVVVFSLIIKFLTKIGVKEFGIRKNNPVCVILFIAYCVYYVVDLFFNTFVLAYQRKMAMISDCDAALLNHPIGVSLIKLYRMDLLAYQVSPIYKMFFMDYPLISERLANIDTCFASIKSK